ncbi:short-chain dehydrogenase/reductase SDR [Histoplasma capsulatum var. duboisii H88]|uniref:Short-chain dehydrogenase/reductase SDR n=1 Tax=Ajellomyces capsulatus (strain H88) TaxID=544711 RepID=F0U8P3_AJEC8|nr:short-chain dehydrogenase/reductase SDR [Histoplasma capsulatum var. duboisii H88]
MAPQDRIAQVSSHLNYPQGLLAGQIAIITGAGQGVGAEAARLFANEGAKKAEAVVKSINDASPGRAIAVVGDVTDPTYVKRVVQKAAEFGNGKIHIIVNNAGYTWDGVIHKVDTAPLQGSLLDKQWEAMIAVHATAPFKLVQVAAPYFRVKDGADRVIVNISSTSGIHGNPGQVNYAVGKAGMVGLTKTIAKEWGPQFGVRANTIAFSLVLTRLTAAKEAGTFITTPDGEKVALGLPSAQLAARAGGDEKDKYPDIPLRRGATPTEAARSILAVVSPLLSYVNGQTIMVTGGRNM